MRNPARIEPWLSDLELMEWLRASPRVEDYQKRLAVWLTYIGPFHAHEVAKLLGVSKQAVWLWVGQYNKLGPDGLERRGRGGRRWSYLSFEEEKDFLTSLEKRALSGDVLTAKQILPQLCDRIGHKVSLAYVYSLLKRHGWRKLGPRPRHLKASPQAQEEFKKNCPP